jgi:hypothetical protein
MRARTRQELISSRSRSIRVIRRLCAERSVLREEVRQLNAAVNIYRELARRPDPRHPTPNDGAPEYAVGLARQAGVSRG